MRFLRHFNWRYLLLGMAFGLLLGTQAIASDPIRGRKLAEVWCVSCHLPHEVGSIKVMTIPSLEEVAQKAGTSEKTLAQLLMMPHPAMQDRGLSRDEAEDVAAYLSSLRK